MEFTKFSDLFKNLDKIHMDISEMAMVHVGSDWQAEHVCSVFTRVYMVLDGCGKICYQGKELFLETGNIYIIPAGIEFSHYCEEYMKKIYFHVSVLLPNHYDVFNRASECFVMKNQQKLIEQLHQRLMENRPSSVIFIKACLYEIMLQCICSDEKMDDEIINYSELIYKIQEYIEVNLSATLTVSQVAEAMFLSPSKLQKAFKKEVGLSVGHYIDKRLMYVAEREVRRGEYSINQISAMLGFCDQFYFSRRFSEVYGVSPLKYRKIFALK